MAITQPQSPSSSVAGCLVRFTWMLAGNFAVAFCLIFIALGPPRLGAADFVLWLAAGAIVGARWLDVRKYAGTTSEGNPATRAHWLRHTVLLGGVTLSLWMLAHAVAWLGAR